MSGPWEDYAPPKNDGPWSEYAKSDTKPEKKAGTELARNILSFVGQAVSGGPLGRVGYMINEASNKALNKAAYEGGGLATDVASKIMSPEAAAGVGLAANVGIQTIPMFAGGALLNRAASPVMEKGAKRLMQSAAKPVMGDLRTGRAAQAIDTMLKEGINVTPGGVSKLRAKIYNLNDEISRAVQNSPETVDKVKVAEELRGLTDKFYKQVNPRSDVASIEKVWEEFLTHPLLAGKQEIPVQLAQEMKQGTYRSLGKKAYGELKGAETEAQKALARGLKNEIAEVVPGVSALNKSESDLLNALSVAERRVLSSMNNNPGGLAWIIDDPVRGAAFMADKSDLFKSLVARMLNSGQNIVPSTVGQAAGASIGAESGKPPTQ